MWKRWWFLLTMTVIVIALVVKVASSNDDSDPALGGDVSGSSEPTASADIQANLEAEQQAATAALLGLADFPSGWSELAPASSTVAAGPESSDDTVRKINECLGLPGSELVLPVQRPRAGSGPFADPDGERELRQQVGVAASTDDATAAMATLARADLPTCLTSTYQELVNERAANPPTPDASLPPGGSVGDVTVARLNVTDVADERDAFRITMPLTVNGFSVLYFIDTVYVRSGRVTMFLGFTSFQSPWSAEEIDKLIELAASRLTAATQQIQ